MTRLAWRGDVLVAATPSGEIAVDLAGHRTLAPPPGAASDTAADQVRAVDTAVLLERVDGTSITVRRAGDEDQLEDADAYEAAWSPSEDRVAVWGEYGPIFVFGADGSPAGEFDEHWKGPTYGVEPGGDRMMSWARDGRSSCTNSNAGSSRA